MALQALKKRESFSDKAYQMLREAILTGELKAGRTAYRRSAFRTAWHQPHTVYSIPARFFRLPAGIDPTLISVHHYLEQHSWIDLDFRPFGE